MSKSVLWLLIFVGGTIGGLIPSLFGATYFSAWGIIGSALGGLVGIYVFTKIN